MKTPAARPESRHCPAPAEGTRCIGINVGAETIKLVELTRHDGAWRWTRRELLDHHKEPAMRLAEMLARWGWHDVASAAVSGRLGRQVRLPQIPTKQAQAVGARHLLGAEERTVVSLGSHGFSVLELRGQGMEVFRENSRCSQGTGNFLRQLVERFSLTIEEASRLSAAVEKPAILSGRCPVILKTDMTHLANKGEDRAAILAGLFDAVCENVLILIKPGLCPRRVTLIGGVARAPRVQATFASRLAAMGLALEPLEGDDGLYVEALGTALTAAMQPTRPPALDTLVAPAERLTLERVPALADSLRRVRRLIAAPLVPRTDIPEPVVLGFDIGSTGSKAVALTLRERAPAWEGYRPTCGDPVGAAQALLRQFVEETHGLYPITAYGATGSGREIVGSLLTACYGKSVVLILNEIAAHAAGACHFDARVDTIFEIGGQDAKYIRLAEGRVVDCAMNEACSAGTGSFIEEQGRKFSGVTSVAHLGQLALTATEGVSLGQHCSVFMAEVIDEAVAAGVERATIIAGLYDSIIRNYLNRVKGSRSVGQVIFCQGMPFASDALAAAVVRQTGSEVIVPPHPGTVGALGIALLAHRELDATASVSIDPARFLEARVEAKECFHCGATVGCGGSGNRCRIELLKTIVAGQKQRFTWGGGCALHDKATRKRKLPDQAPDPFREREALKRALVARCTSRADGPVIGMTDEFSLKGLMPFFATFLAGLGLNVKVIEDGDPADLKRGIQGANVPFCAPMQLYHGVIGRFAAAGVDQAFLPMMRSLPRSDHEAHGVTCPIVQASPDLVRSDLAGKGNLRVFSPIVNVGRDSLGSAEFKAACQTIAVHFGIADACWRGAYAAAVRAQTEFDAQCVEFGRRALEYCRERLIVPVVVLGRPYTIYNTVLNSNVPAILREQGAIGIPVDCYPLAEDTPVFKNMYWAQGQRILRAAHQVRRTPGEYAIYCSNYACGPDSFNLHFFAHIMAGQPFAVIETDGHSGDAGTKTRVEAFLHCVDQDRRRASPAAVPNDFGRVQVQDLRLRECIRERERLLVPWMGAGSEVFVAGMRGLGVPAESLGMPEAAALQRGRRHTSGKECLPMALTLGSLIHRLERAESGERFAYLMASTCGPCRFGVYNLLNQIVLQQQGWSGRVRIWSPRDAAYFEDLSHGFAMLVMAGFVTADLLAEARDAVVTDAETRVVAERVYQRRLRELLDLVEQLAPTTTSTPAALWEVCRGGMFGMLPLIEEAAEEFLALARWRSVPTVMVVGEIYVRSVPFANDFVVRRLQERGVRVHLAPVYEWLEYCAHIHSRSLGLLEVGRKLSAAIEQRIVHRCNEAMGTAMGWPATPHAAETLAAAGDYLREDLHGEAVLSLGAPIHAWRQGRIDGVVSVGPHECMPNKIAESLFAHVSEAEGLPALTLALNGEPLDKEVLESFIFEVKARHARHRRQTGREIRGRGRHAHDCEPATLS